MGLETFGYIKDLVPANPAGTDPKSQGDDHLRGIKQTLLNQFPGFTEGKPITIDEDTLNSLGGIALSGGFLFENDITLDVNYTISNNTNGMSAGPVTINSGITLTIPSGSTYTVV
jgi:hypothetical protein